VNFNRGWPVSRLEPGGDQVLDDLRLPVDHEPLAGQLVQRDLVPPAVELELDPVVDCPVALHPLADAGLDE
jgi:hypothetical protein